MENKKGRGILLKDSNRDPNAGRCLQTWLLRRGLPEEWGPAPRPDPARPPPPHAFVSPQLQERRLDKPVVVGSPSRRRRSAALGRAAGVQTSSGRHWFSANGSLIPVVRR